jgi:hypothetical protein
VERRHLLHALVSTVGHLLLVDIESGQVQEIESHRPEYFGISWFRGSSQVVLSHSGLDNAILVDQSSVLRSEEGFLSQGSETTPKFLSAPHQIVCANDGRVVVTNTGRNRIQVVSFSQPGHYQEAGLSEARWDRLGPQGPYGDHLNSVFIKDDRLYVIAHGWTKGSSLITFSYPSLVIDNVEPIPGRTGLHNVFVDASGEKIACHSGSGAVMEISSGEILWTAGSPVYTRGLAATDELLLVGESQKAEAQERKSSTSGLWLLDRRTWRPVDYIFLGRYGDVHDVRLVDRPDEAHHGFPLQDWQSLASREGTNSVRSRRLAASEAFAASIRKWERYRVVLGSATAVGEGWRSCHSNDLNLAILADPDARTVAFEYELSTGPADSHVSAIFGYRGAPHDQDMCALLLARVGSGASLELWTNRDSIWLRDPSFAVSGLPVAGSLRLELRDSSAHLFVNDVESSAVALEDRSGSLGIRWLGSRVRPVD